jgi:transcriptional antiterminator NusG
LPNVSCSQSFWHITNSGVDRISQVINHLIEHFLPNKDGATLSKVTCFSDHSTAWFALYTSSRREKYVAKLLAERKIENFLPLYRATRHWNKRTPVTLDLPLFPNYVFVRAGQKASLLSVPGVISIVGTEREPWPLPDHEISAFRNAMGVCQFEPHFLFEIGERVRIKTGPLAGIQGVLLRRKSNLRVVLTIQAIKSSVAVEVEEANLEHVDTRYAEASTLPLLQASAS